MSGLSQTLTRAEQRCQQQGGRMTTQRKQVLALLLSQAGPQSAYQLLAQFKHQYQANAQPPTIYRALDFLVQQGLAHRLSSTNQYLACGHITCQHDHQGTLFLLCDTCGGVQETPLLKGAVSQLQQQLGREGFQVQHEPLLEIHGRCASCAVA
ncbi:FUR family transcriptional regulator [Alcanivorax hongdengensis A-11-3]|uniref:FUR family transcriptional regulator n=1 Tax=Alcanivorax hongdengensis A-11-3 TaxID=1177179 RepID=L0W854_9GAMM|nr:transcriptional repressor [Alcanivorax hongdengensis]EKF73149.1 FUR family transcriptional regulator [Alcanivorax hongdengensis A-11-3]